jgi:threonine/homoserine/homoserine lactone efflux protein
MAILVYAVQGISYGFAAAVQPGPFQTYVIAQTLERGWRRTWPAVFAPLLSDGPIIVLVLLVLSQIPVWFQQFLYIAGGLFILYLARGAFIAWRDFEQKEAVERPSTHQGVLKAALMNALSPGPYIFWSLVTGPILLRGWRETPLNGVGFLVGFYLAMTTSLGAIILLFGTARRLGAKVNRILMGISALLLAAFGLYQLWLGLSGWFIDTGQA